MKIFGIEIRRARITDEIETSLPVPDDEPVDKPKSPAKLPLQYHLGQLYARIEAAEKQIDINRRDIMSTSKAIYRKPTAEQQAAELFSQKAKEQQAAAVFRTGDPV